MVLRIRQPRPIPRILRLWYEHRHLTGGVGHDLPQEAPEAFAAAVLDVDAL